MMIKKVTKLVGAILLVILFNKSSKGTVHDIYLDPIVGVIYNNIPLNGTGIYGSANDSIHWHYIGNALLQYPSPLENAYIYGTNTSITLTPSNPDAYSLVSQGSNGANGFFDWVIWFTYLIPDLNDPNGGPQLTPYVSGGNPFYVQEISISLPITWKTFTATNEKNGTSLKWTTSSEHNTAYYDVEKSNDSKNWKTIATQTAAGNSSAESSYEVFDNEIVFGTSYYRIKQIDIDGKFAYSIVKQITHLQDNEISIYPNPCSMNTITISIKDYTSTSKLTIYTLDGKMMLSDHIHAQNNTMDVSHLPKGTYLLRIANSEKTYTSKLVRQ